MELCECKLCKCKTKKECENSCENSGHEINYHKKVAEC